MYADRYSRPHGLNPGGIAFALGTGGVLLFGLSLTAPNFVASIDKPFTAVAIPLPNDPPPVDPVRPKEKVKDVPHVATPQRDPVDVTTPIVATATGAPTDVHVDVPPPPTVSVGGGSEIGTVVAPPHVPVLLGPQLDARYAGAFQPAYPSDERLAGREGRVTVRVLIGADGRVKEVEQVSAASPAFFDATRRQALARWRFRPGTRDGQAVDAWYTLSVRFVLNEE